MPVTEKSGDIFKSYAQWIVCPVNTLGVMGAGLAKQFKSRFPAYFEHYEAICHTDTLNVGGVDVFKLSGIYQIANPTDRDWETIH